MRKYGSCCGNYSRADTALYEEIQCIKNKLIPDIIHEPLRNSVADEGKGNSRPSGSHAVTPTSIEPDHELTFLSIFTSNIYK